MGKALQNPTERQCEVSFSDKKSHRAGSNR